MISLQGKPACATIKVLVGDQLEITAAEGAGPVNAIDGALRKALEVFYPEIGEIRLTDYKVRVLDSESATAARVRVFDDHAGRFSKLLHALKRRVGVGNIVV